MSYAKVTFDFYAEVPDDLRVGEELSLRGLVTVRKIEAQLVDASGYSDDGSKEFIPGDITVAAFGNRIDVKRPQFVELVNQ